ncbi:hydrogenase maturation protease [Streptomyces albidus (ex Kaewkla and Franco 2022)]|uniref:hydrogenase maturation protease n=1 Tax=Streptomyces albidus (ex Kaewkla and Franco 2022) TaxID=722709 RepID=UPI001B357C36|nr:hydrogenase maturation protease [Streptomyces albidus (ex Kaewkla and Franco 2022)]
MNEQPARTVLVDGVELAQGSRVRLRPGRNADVLDLALTGRTAEVDAVEEDLEGRIHIVVTLEGDDGRDFRTGLGHRFFFTPEEVEPVDGQAPGTRILIAGIGNIFFADDAFGPEVITAMRERPVPDGVHIADFGIRGMDLAYRLQDGYDVAVLVDAAPRGKAPGTLYVIEPEQQPQDGAQRTMPEAHGMDPVQVLALSAHLGGDKLPRVLVLGCEPSVRMRGDEPDVVVGLSEPVREAVGRAVEMLESLTGDLLLDPACDLSRPAVVRH